MEVFKTKVFNKWAKSNRLTDQLLTEAVAEIKAGLVEADLGGGIYKKRIALADRGKSGGARVILAYAVGVKIFFIHGFTKGEKENITSKEKQALKEYADLLLNMSKADIKTALKNKELVEVI